MRRRTFIAGLGSVVWPLVARAQQADRVRRIGVLAPGVESDPMGSPGFSALVQALAGLGLADGRNVRMDFRWWANDADRLRALAKELVGLPPDIILTSGPGDGRPPAGDADDPDRLCDRARSRRQRHRPATQPTGREHHRLRHLGTIAWRQVA
jgi:hypothetical protein